MVQRGQHIMLLPRSLQANRNKAFSQSACSLLVPMQHQVSGCCRDDRYRRCCQLLALRSPLRITILTRQLAADEASQETALSSHDCSCCVVGCGDRINNCFAGAPDPAGRSPGGSNQHHRNPSRLQQDSQHAVCLSGEHALILCLHSYVAQPKQFSLQACCTLYRV